MANEQDTIRARGEIQRLKVVYMDALKRLIASADDPAMLKPTALECQEKGAAYFNFAEEFVGNSDLLGAHASVYWINGFAEDCAAILGCMPVHFGMLAQAFSKIPGLNAELAYPGKTAFANMQRMTVVYLKPDVWKDLRKQFKAANLPTYGFDNEAYVPMNKDLSIKLAFVFGVVFISVLLYIALGNPNPSPFQFVVFKSVLAMALAGIAAVIPGFIQVRIRKSVVAGGAIAVFVMAYFWNPAALVVQSKPESPSLGAGEKH